VAWLQASCTEWKNTFSFEVFGRDGKLQIDGLGGSYGVERLTFYKMLPETMLLPMVVLATAATVIASQAVITGAYSLTYQAIQLGLLPRLAILHTSAAHFGQIYIPRVNTALLAGVLMLVLMFRTSSALASAYGIAVTTTMVVDGILGFIDLEAVEVEMVEPRC
jgi:K+ transporter